MKGGGQGLGVDLVAKLRCVVLCVVGVLGLGDWLHLDPCGGQAARPPSADQRAVALCAVHGWEVAGVAPVFGGGGAYRAIAHVRHADGQ